MLVDITTDDEWSAANSTADNPPVLAHDGVTLLHVTGATRHKDYGTRQEPPSNDDARLAMISRYWRQRMMAAEANFRRAKQALLDQARFSQVGRNVPPQHDWKEQLTLLRDTVFAFRAKWLETEKLREATPEGRGRANAMLVEAERGRAAKWVEMEIANFILEAGPDEPAEVSP
jgi:hypothetical protein